MAITLNRFATGDLAYVSKMNTNATIVEAAVAGLEMQLAAVGGGGAVGIDEIFKSSGLIGASAYLATFISDTDISVTSGSVWHLTAGTRARQTVDQSVTFVGKNIGTYYLNIETTGLVTISTLAAPVPIYSVIWSNPGFSLLTVNVPYLFDGEDYAQMLSSPVFGSFARVADRLSAIEGEGGQNIYYGEKILSGLTWDYFGGIVRDNNAVVSTGSGTITLTDDTTHYIEVITSTGVVSHNIVDGFTEGNIPIRLISVAGAAVESNFDPRTWAFQGGAGGGGGPVGIANSGTTDSKWKLYRGAVATLSDVSIEVIRPDDTDVSIRWNETMDQWEYTNDGNDFFGLNTVVADPGGATNSRFTAVLTQPLVIDETERSPTNAPPYEDLVLTAHVSTTTTAVMLRGHSVELSTAALTIADGLGTTFFKDGDSITTEAGARIWASPHSNPTICTVVVPVSDQKCVFAVDAHSDLTATVQIALVGYWDTVQGVGTQRLSAFATSGASITLSGNISTTRFPLSMGNFSASVARGLVHFLEVSSTLPGGETFDVEYYGSADPDRVNDILFQAILVDGDTLYATRFPWMYENFSAGTNVYMWISNNGTSAALFTHRWGVERFA